MDKKAHWEGVYGNKSPLEVSWYQAEPGLSLQLIHRTNLPKGAPMIDIGGGASMLVDRLYEQGHRNLAVLDISAQALDCAKARLGSKANDVDWFEADVTSFIAPRQFNLWHDRAVFHFLTEASDRKKYVATLKRTLRPDGHLIIAAFAIGGPQKCSGLDIVQYDAEKLSAELGEGFSLEEEASEVHITPANREQKFAYFRFIKAAQDSR